MISIITLNPSEMQRRYEDKNIHIFPGLTENKNNSFNPLIFQAIYGRQPRIGEIGCCLSHIELCKIHINNNDEWSMVLEDDILSTEKCLKFYKTIKNYYINEPTIYILGYSKHLRTNNYLLPMIYKQEFSVRYQNNYFYESDYNYCGTLAYICNSEASKILAAQETIFWVADDWNLIKNLGVNVKHIKTPLAYEDLSTISSTGNPILIDNSFSTRPLYIILKIIKKFIFKLI